METYGQAHKVARKALQRDNWFVNRMQQANLPIPGNRDILRDLLKMEAWFVNYSKGTSARE